MKRIMAIVAVAAALVFCVAGTGCAQSSGSADNAITVSAAAKSQVSADSAKITIHIQGDGDSDAQALKALTDRENDIVGKLKAAGVSEQDIVISHGELEAVWGGYGEEQVMGGYWDWDGNWIETGYETWYYDRTDEIVGYSVPGTITVAHIAASNLTQTLQECAAIGVTQFSELSFVVFDRDAAYKQALGAAVDAAKSKAETLAKASGVYVGRVVNMVEDSDPAKLILEVQGDASRLNPSNADTLDFEFPQVTVEAAVTVSYAIS